MHLLPFLFGRAFFFLRDSSLLLCRRSGFLPRRYIRFGFLGVRCRCVQRLCEIRHHIRQPAPIVHFLLISRPRGGCCLLARLIKCFVLNHAAGQIIGLLLFSVTLCLFLLLHQPSLSVIAALIAQSADETGLSEYLCAVVFVIQRLRARLCRRHGHIVLAQLFDVLIQHAAQTHPNARRCGVEDNEQQNHHEHDEQNFCAHAGQQERKHTCQHTADDTAHMQILSVVPQLNDGCERYRHARMNEDALCQRTPQHRKQQNTRHAQAHRLQIAQGEHAAHAQGNPKHLRAPANQSADQMQHAREQNAVHLTQRKHQHNRQHQKSDADCDVVPNLIGLQDVLCLSFRRTAARGAGFSGSRALASRRIGCSRAAAPRSCPPRSGGRFFV